MILGSYRNPPYKSHQHRSSPGGQSTPSISPPPPAAATVATASQVAAAVADSPNPSSSSPKRKRSKESPSLSESSTGLSIGTPTWSAFTSAGGEEGLGSGKNSPRTKVAARFRDLEIRPGGGGGGGGGGQVVGSSQSPRKRVKRSQGLGSGEVETPVQLRGGAVEIPESVGVSGGMLEIGEAPGMDGVQRTALSTSSVSPPGSPTTDLQALRKSFGMTNSGRKSFPPSSSKRLPSPPPPTPRGVPPPTTTSPPELSSSTTFSPSLPHVDESLIDLSTLTWQDKEITGHELDSTSPDDDGEGINGIGFRPTPAMAYARSQKRKAQVEGWKAREAREARQKRIERRRGKGGGSSGAEGNDGEGRRVVRFEGEG